MGLTIILRFSVLQTLSNAYTLARHPLSISLQSTKHNISDRWARGIHSSSPSTLVQIFLWQRVSSLNLSAHRAFKNRSVAQKLEGGAHKRLSCDRGKIRFTFSRSNLQTAQVEWFGDKVGEARLGYSGHVEWRDGGYILNKGHCIWSSQAGGKEDKHRDSWKW